MSSFIKQWLILLSMALVSSSVLYSCSGGEGGTGHNPDQSIGAITGFGSIFVNGVEFDTTNSQISIDGQAALEADLQLGMQVNVTGTINSDGLTGTADRVTVNEMVRGVVESNDGVNTLSVIGQTVEIPAGAIFTDVTDINAINVGYVVEISGFIKSSGIISATRIEVLPISTSVFKLYGLVHTLNPATQSFMLGNLSVNYSGAGFVAMTANDLAVNMLLEVEGTYDAASTTLTATKVEKEHLINGNADKMEMEGYVTDFTSAASFTINSIPVLTNVDTVYRGGVANEITLGMKLEVEGPLMNGVLTASEVEFEDFTRIEAPLASVTIDTMTGVGTFTLVGLDTVGYTFSTTALTDFGGNLGALGPDVFVRVRGNLIEGDSNIVLNKMEVRSGSTAVSLQGPITAMLPGSTFNILGVLVDTTSFAETDFKKQGIEIGRTQFFSDLSLDAIVDVHGTLNGAVITWETAEVID